MILISACSPYHLYHPYLMKTDFEINKNSKIIVAPINLFTGNPPFFNNQENAVYDSLKSYISTHLTFVDQQELLRKKWNQQITKLNGLYNPLTGELEHDKFEKAIGSTAQISLVISNSDFVIFPHIVEREVKLAGANGYWDGVIREVEMKTELRHSSDYNWTGNSSGYSLQIQVFDKNGMLVFESIGGLESKFALDFKSGIEVMVPKTELFQNGEFINEAISIAMHPFVKSVIYPEKPKFQGNSN